MELVYQLHRTHRARYQHGWLLVEKFQKKTFALACCLGASLEERHLLVGLVQSREGTLLLLGVGSEVA